MKSICLKPTAIFYFLALAAFSSPAQSEKAEAHTDPALERWLKPQNWRRDSDTPAFSLGEKGKFDDQHIFSPHVVRMNGEYWMYYVGSQRCVEAGVYKGVTKDPAHPEKSDQRLFKLGLATSKDGLHFTRYSTDPIFSFGDDIHSIVTPALLKQPDGTLVREDGKLRMYFAAVDFPHGTYKHDLYETTSADGIHWAKATLVMENAYAPCVIKEGGKYRLWHTYIKHNPWGTAYAESTDGTHWKEFDKLCIQIDQPWEVKDQVYPMVIKAGGVYIMMYNCYWNDEYHTAIGFAASKDGITWTKNPANPVFRPDPAHDWESHFTGGGQTILPMPDGSFRLWYAARKQPPWNSLYFAIGTAHWDGPK